MDPPPAIGGLAPSYMRRNPAPPMDPPQAIGGLNFPFVHVPGDGIRAGHVVPRRTVPELYANYTPQPPPPPPPGFAQHVPGPSAAYTIAQEQNVLPSNLMPPGMPTSGGSFISAPYSASLKFPEYLLGCPLTPSLGSPFLLRKHREWGIDFYIRVDHAGWYHTYPDAGGPFQGLHEVENAIERYLEDRRYPNLSMKVNFPGVDIPVEHLLYWPDGTRKNRSGIEPEVDIRQYHLAHALVDKYNEDYNLLGNRAYVLNMVHDYQSFCEGDVRMWYDHINFTANAGAGGDDCKLFFAEVICMQGEKLPVSCLCVIEATDDGFCFSCANKGIQLRHPKSVPYVGGHVMSTFTSFNGPKMLPVHGDHFESGADVVIYKYTLEGCDLSKPVFFPGSLAKVYTGPPVWDGGCWRMEEVV